MTDELLLNTVAAMVESDDVADVLAYAVDGCGQAYPSDAVAIMVLSGRGELELLNANSHRVERLELLQIQTDRGPCVDVLAENAPVIVDGPDALVQRWGAVGQAVVDAGFVGAHAYPMHWQGRAVGGLNVFVRPGVDQNPATGQLYADLATLAVFHPGKLGTDELVDRVTSAVEGRAVIEQAKGIIAYEHQLETHDAYDELVRQARAASVRLHDYALQVVREASGGR